jgi:GNAT superfamily N-acetyltransferase
MSSTRPGDLRLRAATQVDETAIVRLCKVSLTTTYGAFMEPERMRPWTEGTEVENYVARMWPRTTVAVLDREVVGVVALDEAVIDLLWVADALRGRGIGRRLMGHAEATLTADHAEAELECFAPNRAGLAFYKSGGYSEVCRYYEAASGVDKVVLRKALQHPTVQATGAKSLVARSRAFAATASRSRGADDVTSESSSR